MALVSDASQQGGPGRVSDVYQDFQTLLFLGRDVQGDGRERVATRDRDLPQEADLYGRKNRNPGNPTR